MELIIGTDGDVRCIYDEAVDLHLLGKPHIRRASHVEPNNDGRWLADLTPVNGPTLGPFDQRTDALAAEVQWLTEHWLATG